MKKQINKGFTLVEILVVIAVLAVLAGISAPIMLRQIEKAKLVEAKQVMVDVQNAAGDYLKDHGTLDYGTINLARDFYRSAAKNGPHTSAADTTPSVLQISRLMRALLGEDLVDTNTNELTGDYSKTNKKYLIVRDAVDFRNGIVRDTNGEYVSLVDPWGREYLVLYDLNIDGQFKYTKTSQVGSYVGDSIRYKNRIQMICTGPDGLPDKKNDVATFTIQE